MQATATNVRLQENDAAMAPTQSYVSGRREATSGHSRSVVTVVPMATATSASPTQDVAREATYRFAWRVQRVTLTRQRHVPTDVTAATATSVRPTQGCV